MMDSWLPDRDLQRSVEAFLARAQPLMPSKPSDQHALMQQFGGLGYVFTGDEAVIHVVAKPCVLFEWTLDAMTPGNVTLQLEWSGWSVPRAWENMVASGTPPNLSGTDNNNSIDFTNWAGPLYLERRDAIRITVLESTISAFTLGLYMKEMPRRLFPEMVPPETP